jgi:hypothetical protein
LVPLRAQTRTTHEGSTIAARRALRSITAAGSERCFGVWLSVALRFGVLGLALACLMHAGLARAEVAPLSSEPRHAFEGGLAYYGVEDDRSSLDLVLLELAGRYVLSPRYSLTAFVGMAFLASSPDDAPVDHAFRSGNPELLLWYTSPLSEPGLRVRIGAGLTGPLAWIERGPDARLHHTALAHAQGLDGLRRMWRWAPSSTSVVVASEVDADLHELLLLHGELWSALLVPSHYEFLRKRIGLLIPAQLAPVVRLGPVQAGPRLNAVLMPSQSLDAAQLSIEPFVALHFGRAFGEVALTVNIDEPLAGRRGEGVWALHLRGGGEL